MTLTAVVVNQALALFAHGFVARALPNVFCLDVVAGVAVRANVMVGLLDRVPRCFFHIAELPLRSTQQSARMAGGDMPISYHPDAGFLSSLPLRFLGLGQIFLTHGDNAPREVGHLLKRRLAVRSGRVGWLHGFHTVKEIK